MFLTESIRSLSSRREDWIGATEEDLGGEVLWFGRGSGLRTERKDKEEESERDGFDETPHIVVRLVQAIVLDLVQTEYKFFCLFRQCFGLTLSIMFFDCKKKRNERRGIEWREEKVTDEVWR